jgi:pSer/pThr/pTyr-binding forkhead associated (FHA) protein
VVASAYLALLGPVLAGPEEIALPGANVILGRDPEQVDVVLTDSSVARLHARIRQYEGSYWLYDEGSASGTFLNFDRLGLAPRRLADGDEIRLGRVRLLFHREETLKPSAKDKVS